MKGTFYPIQTQQLPQRKRLDKVKKNMHKLQASIASSFEHMYKTIKSAGKMMKESSVQLFILPTAS